jgi:hypothetical protein
MALKKIYISGQFSQGKIQNVNKEASFLRNLENKGFIKLYYSFFDNETVSVKYIDKANNQESSKVETRLVFCILMEHASKGDL